MGVSCGSLEEVIEVVDISTYIHNFSNIIKGFMNFLNLSQGRMKQKEEPRFIAADRFAFDSCGSPLLIT